MGNNEFNKILKNMKSNKTIKEREFLFYGDKYKAIEFEIAFRCEIYRAQKKPYNIKEVRQQVLSEN
jgi:hypothetical protein